MTDQIHAGAAAEPPTSTRTGRRALIACAVAAAANTGTGVTTLTNSGAASQTGLRVVRNGTYGFGIESTGPAYGVDAIGGQNARVFGDTSASSGSGVVGLNRDVSAFGAGGTGSAAGPFSQGVYRQGGAYGVSGRADTGINHLPPSLIGVRGRANVRGGLGRSFSGQRAALHVDPTTAPGVPTSAAHEIGDIVVDSVRRVFVCTAAGTPGTWNELGGPPKAPMLRLLPAPVRFIDTRDGTGGVKGSVPSGTTHAFTLTGCNGIANNAALQVPDSATGFVGNITAIGADDASSSAFIAVWPSGPRPTISNVNFGPAREFGMVANALTVALADTGGAHRGVEIFNYWTCDYILDISGYYAIG